ncbi:MAG: GntR family transcriptional regulator [Ferruginibacter sp.]
MITVDKYSSTPKYLQIANSVIREIENGHMLVGENIPSVTELSIELDIARGTVEKGYNYLKNVGIIDAVPRRGFYIKNIEFPKPLKIFLLFNKLSAHKKAIYDSFVATVGEHAVIDFYIYNNDFLLFKRLIANNKNDYTHYVIIPHFMEGEENAYEIINTIPKEKLLLLDKVVGGITGEYAAAYENFEKDIYSALVEATEHFSKYHTLKIVFPSYSYYPAEILRGFKSYCQDYAFSYKVVDNIMEEPVQCGEVYINVMEDELVLVLEKLVSSGLVIGKEVGVISYNETPVKKFILNGITTISTNFHQMGVTAAEMILSGSKGHREIPFRLTLRPSL